MRVNEIFGSIEGEGIRSGYPAAFIRLYGCNLNCSYCDTRYSCVGNDFKEMSIDEIVNEIQRLSFERITLTGGEPLIHEDVDELIHRLTSLGYEVNIETNGSVYIGPYLDNPKVIITADYKSISSGASEFMDKHNLIALRPQDVLKFVVGSIEDLEQMKNVLLEYNPSCTIFVSPVFGKIEPVEIVEFINDNDLQNCRLQLQLHKYVWNPNQRGV